MLGFNPLSTHPLSSVHVETALTYKMISASISMNGSHSFGISRSRNVGASIAEVVSDALAISRQRSVAVALTQATALTTALRRARSIGTSVEQALTEAISVARRRNVVVASIDEEQALNVELMRIKLMAFVIEQAPDIAPMLINRVRNVSFDVQTVEEVEASLSRARSLVIPIAQTQTFSVDFGRVRALATWIEQAEGIDVTVSRLRQLIQSIANVTDYTFTLTTSSAVPDLVAVAVSWSEWITDGDVQRLVARTETIEFSTRHDITASVTVADGTTVIVPTNAL